MLMDSNFRESSPKMGPDQDAFTQLSSCFQSGDLAREGDLLARLCRTPLAISENLDSLATLYTKAERLDFLLEFLLSKRSAATRRLALLGRIGTLANSANLSSNYERHIEDIVRAATPFRFREHEYLRDLDDRIASILVQLKYSGLTLQGTADALLADAETIIPRIDFNDQALDFLFSRRRDRTTARPHWEHEVKLSRAIRHVINDNNLGTEIYERFVDPAAREAAIRQLDPSRGTLVLLAHVGFPDVRNAFFANVFPGARFLINSKRISQKIELTGNGRGLFEIYKSLKNCEMILIAPDGFVGTKGATITVLGKKVEVKEGAPFAAYESRCRTAWFTIGRNGDRFFPIIVRGPERRHGENFSEFKGRFFEFYAQMLNNVFTGAPQNLVYTAPWLRLFAGK